MKRGALAAGLVAVVMWGLAPVATRAAVAHLSPLPLLTIRMTAATLVLLPWAVPLFRRLRARSAGRLAAAGLLGLVGYNLPVTAGLRWLPAATAGLLLATEPVWVMVLGRMFLGERGGPRAWLGSGIALAGVAVLAGPGAVTGLGGYRALAGTGLVLAGTLAFAAYTIVLRPLSEEFGAVPATAASTAVGTLPYLAFAGTLPGAGLGHLGPAVWWELAFLALGSTAAGMLLWNMAVLSGGAARVSLLLYLEPVVSVLGAAVFLGERVTLVTIGGGALILTGVAVASSVRAGDTTRTFGKIRNIIRSGLAAFRLPRAPGLRAGAPALGSASGMAQPRLPKHVAHGYATGNGMDGKIQLTANTQTNNVSGEFPADLLVQLDRSRPRSLRIQLERGLRQSIARGSLPPGTALPPSRVLAAELDVSRSLVVGAYEQLVIEGYLEARQGSGTRVRARGLRGDGAADHESYGAGPAPAARDGGIRRSGLPDPALFPRSEWLRHYRDVLRDSPDDRLLYPHARGEPELRAALTAYLGRVRGVRTTPEQIVVCGGFSQAVTLLCRVLGRRGVTRVAVEDPCFSLYRRIIKATGLEPVPVPVDDQGLRTARLAGLDVGAVLLSPAHSYPSGMVLSADRRVQLLEWARAADALVIEDDYDAELRYDRLPVGALQGLDPDHVIYGGTVSKVLSPALRLGWIATPRRLTDDIVRAKFLEDFATEALGQLTLARFIDSGAFARHLRRVRPVYRARRDSLLAALRAHLPSLRPSGEAAGLHLLLRLPPGLNPATVAAVAARHGVQLEEAARYWADREAAPPALLIGYGPQRESVLTRGIEALGKDLRKLARA